MTKHVSVAKAAEILGVSRGTVYNLIAAGDLESVDLAPSNSPGSITRIPETALQRLLQARTRKPKAVRTA